MSQSERGIRYAATRTLETVASLLRGYSDKDVKEMQRICFGPITPDDRTRYRVERIAQRMGYVPSGRGFSLGDALTVPIWTLRVSEEERARLDGLSEEALDREIRTHAEERLRMWKKL